MYKEKQHIIKVGNSLGIYIKRMGNKEWYPEQNEKVEVEYHKDKIVIRRVTKWKRQLIL